MRHPAGVVSGVGQVPGRVRQVAVVMFAVGTLVVGTATACGPGRSTVEGDGPAPSLSTATPSSQGVEIGSIAELEAFQADVDNAADRITAAAVKSAPAGPESGLAGIVVAAEYHRLTVYWKGKLPDAVQRVIDEAGALTPVTVVPARYSAAELDQASWQLITRPGVVAASGNVDGSGVTATVEASVTSLDGAVTVPVTLRPGTTATSDIGCDRVTETCPLQDGTNAYFGGEQFPGRGCTLGLSIVQSGIGYMVSAGHCGAVGDTVRGSLTFGTVTGKDSVRDILTIQPVAAAELQDFIFAGRWDAVGDVRHVSGSRSSHAGDLVATSGSFTGWRCCARVQEINVVRKFADGIVKGPLVHADANNIWPAMKFYCKPCAAMNTGIITGKGNSGGPVGFPDDAGRHGFFAMGITIGHGVSVPCDEASRTSTCGSDVYYLDIQSFLDSIQAKVLTGADPDHRCRDHGILIVSCALQQPPPVQVQQPPAH